MSTRIRALIYFFVFSIVCVATYAYAAEISDVTISGITATSTTVTWKTDVNTDAQINYGLDSSVGVVRDPTFDKKEHTLTIENLDPVTTYHFRVVSTDEAGNKSATAGFVFTTKDIVQKALTQKIIKDIKRVTDPKSILEIQQTVQDVAQDVLHPPTILGATKVFPSIDSAEITWTTDRESGSLVSAETDSKYDPTSSDPYSITQGDPNESVTKHSVTLIGLDPSTTYHFKAASKDSLGLNAETADDTFQTKSIVPNISNLQVSRIQETSALISWSTGSVLAKGLVSYTNLRTKATKSSGSPVYATSQKIQLTGLEFGTRYTAIISSTNQGGDVVEAKPISFVTVRDVIPPIITKVNNSSTLFPDNDAKVQTIISWSTDEPAYCQVYYTQGLVKKVGGDDSSLAEEANPVTNHLQVIVGFAPGSVYKFWMRCHDPATNASQSDDFVLITPTKEQSIIDLILANFQGTFGWVGNIGKK